MIKHSTRLLLIFFALLLSISSSSAQEKIALIIGNADYSPMGDEWESLSSPIADAEIMDKKLSGLGYKTIKMRDATIKEMQDSIRYFRNLVQSAKVGIFFYSGHARTIDGVSYLIPSKTKISSIALRADSYCLTTIREILAECGANLQTSGVSLLFIDACRDEAGGSTIGANTKSGRGSYSDVNIYENREPSGQAVYYATSSGEYARDGEIGELSPFTKALSDHITDTLAFHDVWISIKRDVEEITGKQQVPYGDISNLKGDFYFNPIKKSTGNTTNVENTYDNVLHEYVDLGLSVMWATCNVGASSPEDYGAYFTWGETQPKSSYTKNSSETVGKAMDDISGNSRYDVARSQWGESWRLPTKSEFQALRDKCTWIWTSQGGISGYRVTSKENGNAIFLPAAGKYMGPVLDSKGEEGDYWSSSPFEDDSNYAHKLSFDDDSYYVNWDQRFHGYTVRPVKEITVSRTEPITQPLITSLAETSAKESLSATGMHQGYGYVDLGLSVMWATCNVGSSTNSPSDYGHYFAWGEIRPKENYTKVNNKTRGKSIDIYNAVEYDAARTNWGGNWRLPTQMEFLELKDHCVWEWTTLNGNLGYKVTSMKNGNSIFLPFAGSCIGKGHWSGRNNYGCYWSSTPNSYNKDEVYCLLCRYGEIQPDWSNRRYDGHTIRPVVRIYSTRLDTSSQCAAGIINGHEYVDLGLSVKWATCNVGADLPEGSGDYFAWGETSQKLSYTEDNSMTYDKPMENIYGNSQYDAARANWGGSWRMPTRFEFQELINDCIWVWTSQGGKNGYRVTSKKNGNSIFLPAAGFKRETVLCGEGESGIYSTSIPLEIYNDGAYRLGLDRNGQDVFGGNRSFGYTIRPVTE